MSDGIKAAATEIKEETEMKVVDTKPVPTELKELDRLRMQEVWLESVASQQALAGLEEQQQRLLAEQKLNLELKQNHQRIVSENQAKMEKLMQEIKENYSIPDNYQIESKTGKITPTPPPAK